MYVSKVAEKINEPHHVVVDESGNEKKKERGMLLQLISVLYVLMYFESQEKQSERETHLRRL